MTITIDCRHFDASGIGVYLRECLPRFLETGNGFLLLGDAGKLAHIAAKYRNAEIVDCAARPFSFRELFAFPHEIIKKINKTSLFYSPFFNIPSGIKVPVYTTIHDIIFPDMPELTSRIGLAVRMWFYRRAFRCSRKIFTVSEFSKSRIEFHLGKNVPVVVTHIAIQSYFLVNDSAAPAEKKEIILFIGNIKKHKGLSVLLDAFFNARTEGLPHKLVIIGEKNNFRSKDTESLEKLASVDPSVVEFTGFVSDEKLKSLLARAALLVQPSLYEGFGLPPLEAMICGTKALVSDIPVFREIYGDFPVTFFRTADAIDLKDKLMDLLYNKQPERLVLPEHLASRYTFEKTASIILKELTEA
jgi:glycosyltransferase involved in cell wall biosynthesis